METRTYSSRLAAVALEKKKEREYWKKKLSGNPQRTGFLYDFKKEKGTPAKMDVKEFILDRELFSRLTILSKGFDYTLHIILVSGLVVVLNKYTGSQDILIGSPIYRQEPGTDFLNTLLVLRNRVDEQCSFKDLLLQVKQTVMEAVEHQNYPFPVLLDQLNLSSPDIFLLLENIHDKNHTRDTGADDHMLFSFLRTEERIEGRLQYNTLLYRVGTIERIIRHFTHLLDMATADVNMVLKDIDLLTEEEKEEILSVFNNTEMEYPRHKGLNEYFEAQVEAAPDRIALVGPALQTRQIKQDVCHVTYKKLNEKVNQLAYWLRSRGVKADRVVAIMLDPSIEMITAVLGILKAGGAYLPIDPETPSHRVMVMLKESGAPVLLTGMGSMSAHSFTALQDQVLTRLEPKVTAPRQRITDMDRLPMTDRSFIDYNKYNQIIGYAGVKHTISLEATRGCPYNCSYCHKIFPRQQVCRSAENLFQEVKYYYDLGVRRFSIIDDIFNLNVRISSRFFRMIIEKGLNKDIQLYFSAGLRGDILTEDYIDLMVEAGTVNVSPALETASPRLQKLIGKNLDIDKFHRNVEYFCKKYPQVITELFIMHGFPTETDEEVRQTMEFVKNLKWVHFPYINILRIYSTTRMAKLAMQHGIPYDAIIRSEDLAWHELPETLPFPKSYTLKIQTEFLNEYFLHKERLFHVLPFQMQVMTEDELVQKYNSYLPEDIDSFDRLLQFIGVEREELGGAAFLPCDSLAVPGLDEKLRKASPAVVPRADALRVFLLDLNLYFSHETHMLYDLVDEPLGLMRLMTELKQAFGSRINGRIAKSRIDFNNYGELKALLKEFDPDVIGIRTITFYRDFVHKTVSLIRQWGFNIPIIAGGPHVTTNYRAVLQDGNIDLVVLGEGEITLKELIEKVLENQGKLPGEDTLEKIPGLAFIPGKEKAHRELAREIVILDAVGAVLSEMPGENPEHINQPGDLAYVIFTSGTTGKPKGALVEHGNVIAYINAFYREFDIKPSDALLQLSPYSFDVFVEEVFPILLRGGRIVIPGPSQWMDVDLLSRLIAREQVSHIDCTPLLLNEFNRLAAPDLVRYLLSSIHTFISGGDVLKKEYVDNLLTIGKVYNTYGPTEATVCITYYHYKPSSDISGNVPIGKPVSNYKVYILDKNHSLQPIGVPGELYVSGPGVARGYLNHPELTAENFLNKSFWRSRNLFSKRFLAAGGNLYRTGDLARWLPDGVIEFCGRVDQQVKIRGYRIELEEIGTHLKQHANVREAVVLAVDKGIGDKYLCAYIESHAPHSLEASEWRDYLAGKLPDYMSPAYFIEVEKIPRTTTGKINRKALLSLNAGIETGRGYTAPQDEIEKKLVDIWCEILDLPKEKVGIDDNFFDLGGHSILAMRVVSVTKEAFDVKLQMVDLFNIGTIRGIAEKIKDLHAFTSPEVEKPDTERQGLIRPFDLSRAPLMRAALIKLKPQRHLLFLDMHHIISDAVSTEIFAREFTQIYTGRRLSALPIQYKDFAHWEEDFTAGEEYRKQEEYWLHNFKGLIPRLELPLDFPKPGARRREGKTVYTDLGTELAVKVKEFAVGREVTLYMLLLAAYNILLARKSGQEDIVVGTPASGRTLADLNPLLGMFVNTLAMRNFPRGHLTFLEFLEDVRTRTLQALENQDYQFEKLVEKLNLSGDADRNPLFDTFFAVEDVFETTLAADGREFTVTALDPGYSSAMFDLVVRAVVGPGDIKLCFSYDVDLFKEATVQNMLDQFMNLLKWILYQPGFLIGEIDMTVEPAVEAQLPGEPAEDKVLTDREREQILMEFNNTAAPYPADKTIHQLFEEQVLRTPDHIAVIAHSTSHRTYRTHMTYTQLNQKSNQLASMVQAKGAAPDTIAAISADRSIETIIGMMGIMKAGGAYLPIDPNYPEARKKYMLEDSGTSVLLSGVSKVSEVSRNIEMIDLTQLTQPTHLTHLIHPTHLAYVIYTSGTTGKPKGVMIQHASLVNFIFSMYRDYSGDFGPLDRCLGLTNFCFDVSVCEIFMPLVWGASIFLLGHDKVFDPEALAGIIQEKSITFTYLPPGLLLEVYEHLRQRLQGSTCRLALNKMLVGVEPIKDEVLEKYMSLNPSMRIVNGYGPTEATICATAYRYESHEPAGRRVPIGGPLDNMKVVLLDKYGHLVPVGVPGELCISGDGLSRGYLNQPELSAEKFTPAGYPLSFSASQLLSFSLYRTGDLAKWLPDGNILFIDRIDHQVKIRGFRIELGEIESVLMKHPRIREAALVVRYDPAGNKYLEAYIAGDGDFTVKELRTYLSEKLPEYMFPAAFYRVGHLPLTPSGKVDRRALPGLEASIIKPGDEYTAPRSPLERKLAALWAEVLKTHPVGIDQDFFHLGGDSLRANLLAARINKEFNLRISVREIFAAPTVKELSREVSHAAGRAYKPVQPVEKKEYYRTSSVQKRQYILHQLDKNDVTYNLPAALLLEGRLNTGKLIDTFKTIIRRHESLRTDFLTVNGEIVQKVHQDIAFEAPLYETDDWAPGSDSETIARIIKGEAVLRPLSGAFPAMEAAEEREYFELSSAQKRLFFLDQFEDIGTSYNIIPIVYKIEGTLDAGQLERGCKSLLQRHQALRTSFEFLNNEPIQRVHHPDRLDFNIQYREARPGHPHADEQETLQLIKEFIRPFNLSKAPLLRVELVRFSEEEHLLLFDLHHIVCDGTSMGILMNEFARLYDGLALPLLKFQYKDYSLWQNRLISDGRLKEQEAYWLELYSDTATIPALNFPVDYPRPPIFDFEGDIYEFKLGSGEASAFKALTTAAGISATLYMNLMAAFLVLLYKYTSQEDIIVGSGIAGRHHPGLEDIIGMFVNTLALRHYPSGGKTYIEFLKEVKETSIKAFENQDVQFEELVDRLNIERDPSRNPLFDVLFIVQNFVQPEVKVKDLTFTPYEYGIKTSKFDLTLFTFETGEEIWFLLEYYTRLFKQETIQRLVGHFKNIITQVSVNPGIRLMDIDILSDAEKHQLLHDFNNTAASYPDDRTIHELFAQQVTRTPDRVGVVGMGHGAWGMEGQDIHLTYKELNEEANRLADYLYVEKHTRPDDRVGVMMSRSLNRAAVVLGILKAGGTYVPIDPSFPEERLKDMINDAHLGVVVSQKRYIRTLNRLQWECPSFHTFLCLDSMDICSEEEVEKSELMGKKLWEYVGEKATDEVTGGGWLSSYTGDPIPKEEMVEYGDNILKKLTPLLHKKMRVLEVGCASGISMYRIAPKVEFYYGTDLSGVIIEKNKERIRKEGHQNIALACLPAHEIEKIEEKDFDLVIFNSVIQCFHGHNYLRRVIGKAVDLLKEKGYLFIGDIMDQELKQALIHELVEFERIHRDKDYKTKTDWSTELFVSRDFFRDLAIEVPGVHEVEFSGKIYTIKNELTKFRYDALITVDKSRKGRERKKHKYQHDLRVLPPYGKGVPYPAAPGNLAYIMYTSGSTGKQKGVMVEHRNVVRLVKNTNYVEFNESDSILQTGALEFDASTFEIWGALLNGLKLYVVKKEVILTPERLKGAIRRYDISTMWMTAPLFNQVSDADIGVFLGLRNLLVGGDVLSPPHINRLRHRFPGLKVINGYGPTENTTFSTTYWINRDYEANIPIGKPIANSTCYILDRHGHPVPIGVSGELYVGGDGVSRGYLNNPELTNSKFPSSFLSFSASQLLSFSLYRTGDLTRWLPDGNIEFLGRFDYQVKIRGFRIELGEIENRLLQHEEIKEAVVIVKQDQAGEQRYLAAYFAGERELEASSLREYLAKELPDFMIPSYFIQLDKLPLTVNGKIDHRVLPEPGVFRVVEGYIAPRDDVEGALTTIWSQVLGVDKDSISMDADFFELGGHSLKATVLVSKIHKEMNIKIPLEEVFRTPTIEELADFIKTAGEDTFVSIPSAEKKEYYKLSSAQKRLYVLQQVEPESTAYNVPIVVKLEPGFDTGKLGQIFQQLVRRHEGFRTSFVLVDGEPVQKIHEGVEFEVKSLWLQTDEIQIIKDFVKPFHLSREPLLRVQLVELGNKERLLMVDMHHILTDGTSNIVLIQEFAALYRRLSLEPLRIQYKDYSEWQMSSSTRALIEAQRAYWLEEFSGDIPCLDLPLDFERPDVLNFEGKRISFEIEDQALTGLKEIAVSADATLFMVLLAVFNIFLSRIGGQEEVIVGTPIAGRRHHDLQYIMGMFVNTLVLKNRCPQEETFADYLAEVRDRTAKAFENQDYQFEDLVSDLLVEREPGRHPLFDVMLVLQNMEIQPGTIPEVELSELQLKQVDVRMEHAVFDLIFMAYETGENLAFFVDYNTRLFRQETIERFFHYFKEILIQVMENKSILLKDIAIAHELVETKKKGLLEEEGDFAF